MAFLSMVRNMTDMIHMVEMVMDHDPHDGDDDGHDPHDGDDDEHEGERIFSTTDSESTTIKGSYNVNGNLVK